ncbi:hypothetical protein D0869_02700 [Hortaea werneckii]|uniref:Heterokaryon incompatibility domain-containing protein n=1 Tax=Hortaea werneckii TaxID=91943 RepID=A0A3M7ABW0_HORWE|nr:hypothetical protein D0869_02700 [Hortaea werneckii]RMY24953.1 hypothetical protein D0867_01047 [Hortaea werneckii]
MPLEGQSRMPRRLIDLSSEGHVSARLVQTQAIPSSRTVYTALSYCWGDAHILKTTKATLDRHLKYLPIHEIPLTVTDAFAITRRLGLRYIWVDALCIVQDDEDDWNGEVGSMHEIFAGSYLTLLAAEADSAAGGLFTQQPRDFSARAYNDRTFLHTQLDGGRSLKMHLCPQKRQQSALRKRGWTLQEEMLSRRTVQVSNCELVWHCQYRTIREIETSGKMLEMSQEKSGTVRDAKTAEDNWRNLLENYSGRHLSVPDDRLRALAGLASFFQQLRHDECLLGLWRKSLLEDLTWRRIGNAAERPLQPQPTQMLPSWSPLSCDQSVDFNAWNSNTSYSRPDCVADIVHCCVVWTGQPWLSSLQSSSLVLRGPTRELFLEEVTEIPDCNPPYFNIDEEEVKIDENPLPWRCAVQWDFEGYRPPQKWKCLLLQRKTVSGFALGGETFLVLEVANKVQSPVCYRRIGIGSLGRHRNATSKTTQRWKFELDEVEEIALV